MGKMQERLAAGKPYFVAEMSANHGNDLDTALQIVDAAASAGADCLKVQTYTADSLTLDCDNEFFRINGGLWDGRQLYELYSEASFPYEWHLPVRDRCLKLGMDFLSTPFDAEAVDFLLDLGVEAFKIASFELVDIPLLEYAASKGLPMLVSTGMASLDDIQDAVDAVRGAGCNELVLLRCCSEYPANPADMNLASIPDMANRFECHVGFSDHSMGYTADVVAASLGARVIEKHFCLNRAIETADSKFSMTPDEFRAMVDAVNVAVDAVGEPCFEPTPKEAESLVFRRSVFACADIAEGESFTEDNIRVVRPGYGARPKFFKEMLGSPARKAYSYGEPVIWEHQ